MSKKSFHFLFLTIIGYVVANQGTNVCQTESCRLKSRKMKALMDESIDPCDDFYSFACGKYVKDTPIPPGQTRVAVFINAIRQTGIKVRTILEDPISQTSKSVAVKKVIQMFQTCKNVYSFENEHKETFRKLFNNQDDNEYGGCPMVIGNDYDNSRITLEKMVALMIKNQNQHFLMKIKVDADSTNSKGNIIYLDQGKLGLDKNIYRDTNRFATQLDGYKGLMKNTTKYLVDLLGKTRTDDQIDASVNGVFNLEDELSKIMMPPSHYRNVSNTNNPTSINELNQKYPNIKWNIIFDEIYGDRRYILSDSDKIINKAPDYFEKLNELVSKTPKTDLINNAYWLAFMKKFYIDSTREMRDIYLNYRRFTGNTATLTPRNEHCISKISYDGLAVIGSHLFLQKYFPAESKVKAEEIVEEVQKVWEKRMWNYAWMDSSVKTKAKCKLDLMETLVGSPDWMQNYVDIDYYHTRLAAPDPRNNLVNFMNMYKFLAHLELKKLNAVPNRSEWKFAPTTVDTRFIPRQNSFMITAGIMQEPLFQSNYPMYLNLGSMGLIVGHETAHGFGIEGSQYDHLGNYKLWWDQGTIDKFNEKAQCFVDQFDAIEIPEWKSEPGWEDRAHLNGTRSLYLTLADNSGLVTAYDTLKKYIKTNGEEKRLPDFVNFSNEKMFFLSLAQFFCDKNSKESLRRFIVSDPYPPLRHRILGSFKNFKGFADTYNCPVSKNMNRGDKRCTLY